MALFQRSASSFYNAGVRAEKKKDLMKALQLYTKAAHMGHADALTAAGKIYYMEYGPSHDIGRAEKYWRLAAEKDHPEALYLLGDLYLNGPEIWQNEDLGTACLQRASILGYEKADELLNAYRTLQE